MRRAHRHVRGVDLSAEMSVLADSLGASGGRALAVQFVSARSGEGASTVAREFARALVGRGSKGVWLVELDVMAGAQYDALMAGDEALGAPVRASPDQSAFFQVLPPTETADGRAWPDASYLAAYPVGQHRFWVTRFRREGLAPGQTVQIVDDPSYWASLREHADVIVVDAPAAERSRAAAAVAPYMDTTVVVVSAENGDPRGPQLLRDGIEAVGGRCSGVVLNRAKREAPAFVRDLLP